MNEISRLIQRSARYWPDKIAVTDGQTSFSFSQVDQLSTKLAAALLQLGLCKGDRVGLLLHNSSEYVVTDFALMKAGLVRVPLNTRLAHVEHDYILRDAGASALIYSGDLADQLAGFELIPSLRQMIQQGGSAHAGLDYDTLINSGSPDFKPVAIDLDDIHQILYTSGTTGKPKGATTNYRSRHAALVNVWVDEVAIEPSDVMLHVASLSHGSGTKVLPHFVKGATNVLLKKYSARAFCEVVQKQKVTTTWVVPTIVGDLLEFPELDHYDISSLKTIIYAGAPMPVERLRAAIQRFGQVFVQVYGLSEVPNPCLVLRREDHLADGTPEQINRLAAAGREVTAVSVRVVNDEGQEIVPGEVGEIAIKGDNVMCGYWGLPEATAESLRDGWFYTGDLATVDKLGYVFIVDRKKDMIISGGYNVYPREVEEVMLQHEALLEACVFGVPDGQWGEAVRAAVVVRPGKTTTEQELLEWCRGRLGGYKRPKALDFMPSLPKNANGKIDKKALRDPFWAGYARKVN